MPEELQILEQFSEVAKTEPFQEHRGGCEHSAEAFERQVLACLLRTSRGSHHTETSRHPHLDFLGTRQSELGQVGSVQRSEGSKGEAPGLRHSPRSHRPLSRPLTPARAPRAPPGGGREQAAGAA